MTAEHHSDSKTDAEFAPADPSSSGGIPLPSGPLRSLIAAYDHAVIFRESMPSSFALAKLFTEMAENHGGLVLVGVESDGTVVGLPEADLQETWSRFERLCAELTETRVELGTLQISGRTVIFLIFNTLPRNLQPFTSYRSSIDRTCLV